MEQPSTNAIPPKDSSESSSDISSKLKRYRVHGHTAAGIKYLGAVEAVNPLDAGVLGWGLAISLCHSCSHPCEDAEFSEITVEVDE